MYRSRIYVDREGLEGIRALSSTHTMVFVPTHKSHLDYMVFCYILFVYGLTCPHIAAGARLHFTTSSSDLVARPSCSSPDPCKVWRIVDQCVISAMQNAAPTEVEAAAPQEYQRLVEQGVLVLMRVLTALTCTCRYQPQPARGWPHPARPGRLLHPPQIHGLAGQLPVPRGAGRCGRVQSAQCWWPQRMQRRRLLASAELCLLRHAMHACLAWRAVSALVRVAHWQPEASSECAGAVWALGAPRSADRVRLEGQPPRAGYIRAVLEEGLPLEVFIEGGRSRDGRITLPRLGILSFVVDAFLDGRMDKARAQQGPHVHPHAPPLTDCACASVLSAPSAAKRRPAGARRVSTCSGLHMRKTITVRLEESHGKPCAKAVETLRRLVTCSYSNRSPGASHLGQDVNAGEGRMTESASKSKAAKAMEAGARAGPQDIALVPIAMSYDRPAEEGALVTELSGIPKEKESLASLLAAAGSLAVGGSKRKATGRKEGGGGGSGREAIGADIMRVGEIVTLERFLMARRSGAPCS